MWTSFQALGMDDWVFFETRWGEMRVVAKWTKISSKEEIREPIKRTEKQITIFVSKMVSI